MNNSIKTAVGATFGFTIAAGVAVECSLFALALAFVFCTVVCMIALGVLMEQV